MSFDQNTLGGDIHVAGVTKQFSLNRKEQVQALAEVNLTIPDGAFVALFGPSGCGKSTLLRLIAGLETPTTGSVHVGGAQPRELVQSHRLGYVFQEHALMPWLTVRQNIELPFRLAKREVDDTKVDDLVELIGLTQFADARPKQLSGGMRQRVAIARALTLSPSVLLLDEPFGALDEITRRKLNFELARIWQQTGVTTVLVTHSAAEAVLLADRVEVMAARPGRLAESVDVPLPRPRTIDSFEDSRFPHLEATLIRALDNSEVANTA